MRLALRLLSRLFLFGLVLFLACGAWAQSSNSAGAIKGIVTDAQGASVPGATVVLTNTDTAQTAQQSSQANGAYVFPLLQPGNYKIEIKATGFSPTTLSNLKVQVATVTTANAQIKVGAVATEVTVTGAAQLVDTSTATTGDVITGQQAVSIPLPTRNFLDLMGLQTNTTTTMQSAATAGRGTDIVYVSGSRGTTNNFVLDGIDANSIGGNSLGGVPIPSPDAVEEFKVSTSLYDASQGRGSGGEISVVLKNGTDKFHGGAFEFVRNSDLNANDFFANRAGKARPVLLQNQFGGQVGGPVPKLSHTFWFFAYQGTRQKNGVSGLISGSQPVLPATRDAASLAAAFNTPAHPVTVATIDPVAVKWLNRPGPYGGSLYPSGTCVGVTGTCGPGSIGTLTLSNPAIYNEDQEAATVSHDFSQNNHVALQWFYSNGDSISPTGGGVTLGQGSTSSLGNRHLALSDRYTFTPNLLNDFRTGFTHIISGGGPVEGTTVGDIGMSKWDAASFPGTPAVSISGLMSWGGIGVNSASVGASSGITTSDTLSWTHGAHNLRVGGEWIRYRQMSFNQYGSRGSMSFPTFQDFLTGTPNRLQIDVGNYYRYYLLNSVGSYVQDDWHASRRLTLNLGARVENLGFPWEKSLHTGVLDPQLVTPACKASGGANQCVAQAFVAPANATSFPTPGVADSGLVKPLGTHISPRLGFAYDVFGNSRMAVRGGFGMYYIQISTQSLLQLIASAPWVLQSTLSGTAVAGSQALANPWPAGLPQVKDFPVIPNMGAYTGLSSSGSAQFSQPTLAMYGFGRRLQAPYLEQYNLDVQTELARGWTMDTGYVGSRGLHLLTDPSQNQALLANAAHPGFGGLTVNSNNNSGARVNIPGYSSEGLDLAETQGLSNYNAFTLELQHPFAKSLQFKMAYTYSKSLDNDSGGSTSDLGGFDNNQLDPSVSYGPSNFNTPQRLVFQYVWTVPGPTHGWAGRTLGGWGLSGTWTLQSGMPFDVTSSFGGGLFGMTGYSTANAATCSGGGPIKTGSIESNLSDYLNKTCFATPTTVAKGTVLTGLNPNGTPGSESFTIGGDPSSPKDPGVGTLFGTLGRNTLQRPHEQRFDMALLKNFAMPQLGEGGNLQLRAEAFKLFNNVIFSGPSSNVDSATFGAITSTIDGTGRIIQLAIKLSF